MGFIVRNRFRRSALCIIRSRSSKSPPLHDSHNFKYRNAASSDQISAAKGPRKLSSRTKYKSQESLPGKKKRFPPINFRRSCESFSTPSRHIISPNHRSSPIASPSFSLVRPQSWLPPSSGEFVITRREPRNRNFAGYDDIYIYIYGGVAKRPDEKESFTPFDETEKDGLNQIYRLPAHTPARNAPSDV